MTIIYKITFPWPVEQPERTPDHMAAGTIELEAILADYHRKGGDLRTLKITPAAIERKTLRVMPGGKEG